MQRILHTPEGVRDIYSEECAQKLALQDRLHRIIKSYGYRDIETPTFEFFDVFGREIGTTPSRELYKFFDREGNTLVLRPDFTPSVARAAARYFPDDPIVRLTYLGNTFINNSSYQGRLREQTQIGAEMIGDDSADADAEIIALVVQLLKASGLKEFQISLGHVGFFYALARQAGLDGRVLDEMKVLIKNKNTFGVEKLLAGQDISEALRQSITALTGLFGAADALDRAMRLAPNEEAASAVERLRSIWEILKLYGAEQYVTFDFGMLSSYMYYTGIIFRGYTYGTGAAVIRGGRYDNLLAHFGKTAPAVGFVTVVDQLQTALSRQKAEPEICRDCCIIIYSQDKRARAVAKAMELRKKGIDVELVRVTRERKLEYCRNYAASKPCTQVVEL